MPNAIIAYIFGIATGMYLHAQNKEIHMPVIHSIDPIAIGLTVVLIVAVFLARKKNLRRGNRK